MRHGLYRMAWSSNPMEASPLGLRSVTVLPRALLDVSPDTLWGDDNNNKQQQPSVHQQPPVDIAPGWFVNPFEDPYMWCVWGWGWCWLVVGAG